MITNPMHPLNASSSIGISNRAEQPIQHDLITHTAVTNELSKMVKNSPMVTPKLLNRSDLTRIEKYLSLRADRAINDNAIKKSLPKGFQDKTIRSDVLAKYQTLRFERSTKKIIHVTVEFNRFTNLIGSTVKYLKRSAKNIANASIQLYDRAKMINQKYAIGIGDQTKNLTEIDKGGAGTIFINSKKTKVFKKFCDSNSAKEANKECQFSLDIHAKVKKKGLSTAGLPPRVQLILGLNGEVKGMKQTAFTEAGLHKYMDINLKKQDKDVGKSIKLDISLQMLEGFATFDIIDFCHLDIKPANILIDKKNDVITAGFGDLGSAIDFSSKNVGKIIQQIKEVKFSDSHVNKDDNFKFGQLSKELEKLYLENKESPELEGKLIEIKELSKNMAKHALGMTLAQLYYTEPQNITVFENIEGKEDPQQVVRSSWFGIAITKKESQQAHANSIEAFLEEDSKCPESEQKCPSAIRDLIEKMTNPEKRDQVSSKVIQGTVSRLQS